MQISFAPGFPGSDALQQGWPQAQQLQRRGRRLDHRRLDAAGVPYRFHDFRKDGLDPAKLQGWIDAVGWETLLNKAGTTYKKLDEAQKENLDAAKAKALMLEQPSMIKRPVLDVDGKLTVGFKPEIYQQTFKA